MANRRINARRVSCHFSYTIEEAADALGVHKNTVRQWIKSGLPLADAKRPAVISGKDLVSFLNKRKSRRKRSLRPGEFYCLKCRVATRPDGDMVDFTATSTTLGSLMGLCSRCGSLVYRRVSQAKLAAAIGDLDVQILPGPKSHKRDVEPQP